MRTVEETLEEEPKGALGCERHERTDERRGCRNGKQERRITTELGSVTMQVPRARFQRSDGSVISGLKGQFFCLFRSSFSIFPD